MSQGTTINPSAAVNPCTERPAPVKAKLRERGRDLARLFFLKGYPDLTDVAWAGNDLHLRRARCRARPNARRNPSARAARYRDRSKRSRAHPVGSLDTPLTKSIVRSRMNNGTIVGYFKASNQKITVAESHFHRLTGHERLIVDQGKPPSCRS